MDAHNNKMQRVETIQLLRGVAALLVVLTHTIDFIDLRRDYPMWEWLEWQGINTLGSVGVDIFFVISGFAMAETLASRPNQSVSAFLSNRIMRIVPLYWLVSLAGFALLAALGVSFGLKQFFDTFTILPFFNAGQQVTPILGVGWTLAFEFAFYLVVAAGMYVTRGKSTIQVVLAMTLVLGCLSFSGLAQSGLPQYWLSAFAFEFAAGIALHIAFRRGFLTRLPGAGWVLIIAAIGGFSLAVANNIYMVAYPERLFPEVHLERLWWWGLPSIALVWGAVAALEHRLVSRPEPGVIRRSARYIGDASYSIYLIHLPVLTALEMTFPTLPIPTLLLATALIGVSIFLGVLCYRFVEQPLAAFLKRPRKPSPVLSAIKVRPVFIAVGALAGVSSAGIFMPHVSHTPTARAGTLALISEEEHYGRMAELYCSTCHISQGNWEAIRTMGEASEGGMRVFMGDVAEQGFMPISPWYRARLLEELKLMPDGTPRQAEDTADQPASTDGQD